MSTRAPLAVAPFMCLLRASYSRLFNANACLEHNQAGAISATTRSPRVRYSRLDRPGVERLRTRVSVHRGSTVNLNNTSLHPTTSHRDNMFCILEIQTNTSKKHVCSNSLCGGLQANWLTASGRHERVTCHARCERGWSERIRPGKSGTMTSGAPLARTVLDKCLAGLRVPMPRSSGQQAVSKQSPSSLRRAR